MSKAIFAFKDMPAEAGLDPFPSINAFTAIRETREHIINNRIPKTMARDFALYQLAEYDALTLRVTPLPDPKHIIDVSEIVLEVEANVGNRDQ